MSESELLKNVLLNARYAVFATVNGDGSPHNSPLFLILSKDLKKIFIGTDPNSLHGKNIIRTKQAFAVIFEQTPLGGRGIYFKIENFKPAENPSDLENAVKAHNEARAKIGKDALPIEYYQPPNRQRMFTGQITVLSTNRAERDSEGRIVRDTRYPIDSSLLI